MRAATDDDNLPDASAAVGGGSGDEDGGRGRTLTGKRLTADDMQAEAREKADSLLSEAVNRKRK